MRSKEVCDKISKSLTGIKRSEETKNKFRLSKLGSNNPSWKGDGVGCAALHDWIRDHLPKPKLCQKCERTTPYDLANITGIYNRDFKNWKYLCRRCHMILDGRMDSIKTTGKIIKGFQFKYDNLMTSSGNLIENAIIIALNAHKGKKDKAGFPYILHPLAVMSMVTKADEKIVAVLHDVIEDTPVTLEDLEKYEMPDFIIDAVDAISKRKDENYKEYIKRCGENPMARHVKLADLDHNTNEDRIKNIKESAIKQYNEAKLYLKKKELKEMDDEFNV